MIYPFCIFAECFPTPNKGDLAVFVPRQIVTQSSVSYAKLARAYFGKYIEAHVDPDVTNTFKGRTFAGLYLGATGNRQDTVKVLELETGVVKKVCNFTTLNMSDCVIRVTNAWGTKAKWDDLANRLEFLNQQNKEKYSWSDDNALPQRTRDREYPILGQRLRLR